MYQKCEEEIIQTNPVTLPVPMVSIVFYPLLSDKPILLSPNGFQPKKWINEWLRT